MCSGLPNFLQGPVNWLQGLFGGHAAEPPLPPAEPPAAVQEPHEEHPLEEKPAQLAEAKAEDAKAPVVAPPTPLEAAKGIEHGLSLLKAELCKRLETKAQNLNAQTKAVSEKLRNIDKSLSLLSQYSQKNPDGTNNASGDVDCSTPEMVSVKAALVKDGISAPIPDGILSKNERGHVVNVLSNQRNLLSDEQRELTQEFQQCAVERNSFFQALQSLSSELHRALLKIIGNLNGRSA